MATVLKLGAGDGSDSGPLLVDAPTAARLLGGISERTIARLVRRGELPAVHIARRVLFDPVDIRDFIARAKAPAPVLTGERRGPAEGPGKKTGDRAGISIDSTPVIG